MSLNRFRFLIAGVAASCMATALFALGVSESLHPETMVCLLQDTCEGAAVSRIYQVGFISYFILNVIPFFLMAWLFQWLPSQPVLFMAAASGLMLISSMGWWWGLSFLFQRLGLLATERRLRILLFAWAAVLLAGNVGLIWYFAGDGV